MEVDSDGCWQHHEMSVGDTSDIDYLSIDGIHSQSDTDVSDEDRDADKFTSELREGKIGKFHQHTGPTKLFICVIYLYSRYNIHVHAYYNAGQAEVKRRCLTCDSAN